MNPPPKRLYLPKRVRVGTDAAGRPADLGGARVEAVREEWLVEDRWWTPRPLERRYFELVLADGSDVVVYREPAESGRWFRQRA